MSWILRQLSGALGPYLLIALGMALLGLSVTTKVLWSSNTELREDLAVARASITSLSSANEAGQDAIGKLKIANEQWVTLFDSQKAKNYEAVAQLELLKRQLVNQSQTDAVHRERQEPDCAILMAMDIQRMCPVTAQRMRDDASRSAH
jgi:hypothetical protein